MTAAGLPDGPGPTRRSTLRAALIGAPMLAYGVGTASSQTVVAPAMLPDGAHVTVAGPEGGELDHWSRTLVPALNSAFSPNILLRRSFAGGIDGVTGANQFSAQASPDGSSALLAPGSAFLARLRGDPRVQFEAAHWVPLLAAMGTAVIVGRVPASQLIRGQKLRIGVSGPNGPEMAAVLGLELLGLQAVPVAGVIDQATAEVAFAQHAVDALLLRGPAIANVLSTAVARAICVLGTPDASGALTRDPMLPAVPQLSELLGGLPDGRPTLAWRAAATAAQLAFSLILPPLTPAGAITAWRRAVEKATAMVELQAFATAQAVRLHTTPETIHAIATDPEAMAGMRDGIAERQRR